MERFCGYCGGGFLEVHRRGRPQLYCSVACRSARQYEVGRVNSRLERLEARRAEVIAKARRWEQGMVPVMDRQIGELTDRLHELTSGSAPHTTQEDPARG